MNHNYAAGDDALKLMDVASVRLTRTMVVTKLSRTRTGFISLRDSTQGAAGRVYNGWGPQGRSRPVLQGNLPIFGAPWNFCLAVLFQLL